MPDHTPGPIHIEHEFNLIASDGYSLTSASGTDSVKFYNRGVANAKRAVLCWNSHAAIVALLQDIRAFMFDEERCPKSVFDAFRGLGLRLDAALESAGAK